MDRRRLRAGEWIAAASGALLVVSLFLPWYEVGDAGVSAFDAYGVVDALLLLVGLLGVGLLLVTAMQRTAAVGVASDALLTVVAGIVVIVAAIRVVQVPSELDAAGADRTAYAWIGLAAALGVLVGAVIAMRDERLSKPGELTDAAGLPVAAPPEIETIPAPPRGGTEP